MNDTRLELFTSQPVAVSTNTTTNGVTLDLMNNYVTDANSLFEGAPAGYGIGVRILFNNFSGTRLDAAIKWQVSDNGSTWVDDQVILDDTNMMTLLGTSTKVQIYSRLRTPRRYARIVVTSTDVTGSGAWSVQGWAADGSTKHGHATVILV